MEDLVRVLTKFHRDVVAPDFQRLADELRDINERLDGVYGQIDGIHKRFDRLETEYHTSSRVDGLQGQDRTLDSRTDD